MPLRAQTQDICLGGLYVEMAYTQKIATALEITLWIGDVKVCGKGMVVSNHPSYGNGIKFTFLTEEGRQALEQFLEHLTPFGRPIRSTASSPVE